MGVLVGVGVSVGVGLGVGVEVGVGLGPGVSVGVGVEVGVFVCTVGQAAVEVGEAWATCLDRPSRPSPSNGTVT